MYDYLSKLEANQSPSQKPSHPNPLLTTMVSWPMAILCKWATFEVERASLLDAYMDQILVHVHRCATFPEGVTGVLEALSQGILCLQWVGAPHMH